MGTFLAPLLHPRLQLTTLDMAMVPVSDMAMVRMAEKVPKFLILVFERFLRRGSSNCLCGYVSETSNSLPKNVPLLVF